MSEALEIVRNAVGIDGPQYDSNGRLVFDPADPLAPIKAAVKDADEDLAPGLALEAVAAMAAFGMDDPTRVTVRSYVKKNKLFPLGDFDRIVFSAVPIPPRAAAQLHTPPPEQPEQVCDPHGLCIAHPALGAEPDIIAKVVGAVGEMGVAGETRIVKATYLTAVSQVLDEPTSLVVKGTSAGGKSYSTKTTLRLVPEASMYAVTAGSQRSLIYTDEEFDHRTIVMFEATALREVAEKRDGDLTAMIIRTLMSEGRLVYDVTEKDETGRMATRRITKLGPTNLIITTTAENLHNENETRLLSLSVDESEDQTRRVMQSTAARRYQAEPADPPDLRPWHALFHWVKYHGEHRVFVPYADYLSKNVTAKTVRMRRDFNTLLGMIEAHAVVHQLTRAADEYGRIIATPADYTAAREILADAFAVASGRKVKESTRRVVEAVRDLGGKAGADGRDVLVAQVAEQVNRDRSIAQRGLKAAVSEGYLDNREDKPGKPGRYRLGAVQLPEDSPALPEVLPPDVCVSTAAQDAHPSPQVSEGCAAVQLCAGGPAAEKESTRTCPGCGEDEDSHWHAVKCLGENPAA